VETSFPAFITVKKPNLKRFGFFLLYAGNFLGCKRAPQEIFNWVDSRVHSKRSPKKQ
jgi:hypothetical protein